jgi:NTE family protein
VSPPLRDLPDALVLGAGGTLGEAWMRGILTGARAAGGADMRRCEYFVGTSAGSIVAAALAAGREPQAGDRAAREWSRAAPGATGEDDAGGGLAATLAGVGREAARLGAAAAAPLAPLALIAAAPAGAMARAAALAAGPRPERTLDRLRGYLEGFGAPFDGRLRVSAVDRRTGRRVMFGEPGAPPATVPDAVLASCAVPWLFAPVEIDGREYVDGGVWSPVNLDAAPVRRGARIVCLNPTATLAGSSRALAALRAASRASAGAETLALRARGAEVELIVPGADSTAAMGTNLMDRRRIDEVLDAAVAQGRALASTE